MNSTLCTFQLKALFDLFYKKMSVNGIATSAWLLPVSVEVGGKRQSLFLQLKLSHNVVSKIITTEIAWHKRSKITSWAYSITEALPPLHEALYNVIARVQKCALENKEVIFEVLCNGNRQLITGSSNVSPDTLIVNALLAAQLEVKA
ncbi:MAG: hypothetical protein NT141_00980 [candidate division WWE3 bacterium]|nr:hypothetical protein [candidate division WWE3 bacterium]